MKNILRKGMEVLRDWRDEFMSEMIEYHNADGVTSMSARVGFSNANELDDFGEGITEVRNVDFVIAAGIIEPKIGDVIVWNKRQHRLLSKNGQPCWRNADNHGVSIRIHTKDEGPIKDEQDQ